jgi:hypothetical protein
MNKRTILIALFSASVITAKAAGSPVDTTKTVDPPLILSGSVDAYYKYDFSGHANIPTSFATDQNSISIGMIDLGLKKKVGKTSFVGEVSFGPRSDQSLPAANTNYHIQNLYVSYDVTDKFNLTGGFMSTFIGYEVISPAGNFNYSTSYLFTNGPFQNAGFKATYAFSDKVSLMAGIFNDQWNAYRSAHNPDAFGAQLFIAPAKGWTAYLNLITANNSTPTSGTELDLTTAYQITNAFKLGLNAADYSASNGAGTGGFEGVALYPQLTISKAVTLGLRGEYFKNKTGSYQSVGPIAGQSVTGLTLTANIKSGPLTLIPEIRLDSGSKDMFYDHNSALSAATSPDTRSASQFVLAAVYAF